MSPATCDALVEAAIPPSPALAVKIPSVAAIVVTYNRLALLQECIAALRAQTRPPDEIIVVNNSATDGTTDWLAEQTDLTVIVQENSGSSGGQFTGIKTAYHNGHDWFWCMDDDTIPYPDALQNLIRVPRFRDETTGFLCSTIVWTDGKIYGNSHQYVNNPADWFQSVLSDHCVATTYGTFVSILVSRRSVATVGLPLRDMFLLGDDIEYTERISGQFRGFYVLDSFAVHKTPTHTRAGEAPVPLNSLKHLYGTRNSVFLTRLNHPSLLRRWLVLAKRALKLGSRWVVGNESSRGLLWFARGLMMVRRVEWP
jgi:GT2 family glycosyltransferase